MNIVQVVLATVTILQSTAQECSHGDVQTPADPTDAPAVVQFCYGGTWISICHSNKWGQKEANIVCNQLGYRNKNATAGSKCLLPDSNQYLKNVECNEDVTVFEECAYDEPKKCDNKCDKSRKHSTIHCQPADCKDKIRLVGGSTNREGRVEVCMDGRWGTVCNKSQKGIAGAVCTRLGFPVEGSFSRPHLPGVSIPVYSCSLNAGTGLNCATSNDIRCDHSRDLGVLCLSKEEINQVLDNILPTSCSETTLSSCENTSCPTTPCECTKNPNDTTDFPTTTHCICDNTPCPTIALSEVTSTKSDTTANCPPVTDCSCDDAISTVSTSDQSAPTSSTANASQNNSGGRDCNTPEDQPTESQTHSCVSTPVLGGVVGVLVTVLVVLVIGWSVSCVALVKRISHTQKQTQGTRNNENSIECQVINPVYGANMEEQDSNGPTYELIDTNKGTGPIYSVLEQHQESKTEMAKTTTENKEHPYHVLESGESEGVTGKGGDYEVPVSGQTNSQVKLCAEEYSTLQH